MNRVRNLTIIMMLVLPALLFAQTPQTIAIDGVNDFDPLNLVDADGGDTEHVALDIGDVFVTNDVNNLYIGFDHDRDGWGSVQLGIAIDVNNIDGGHTDPWGRQLEWSLALTKPDFMFYTNLDNSWQAGYYWDGGTAAWTEIVTSGPNALGWSTTTGFNEISIMLATLGVAAGSDINIEMWTTQDGSTKGPFDSVANDATQLSAPGNTIWDVTSPIPMFDFLPYLVQGSVDNDPPVLLGAVHLTDSVVDVTFNEPVDPLTAEVAGN
ncbi:hypothetical protein HOD41_02665, partial [bacterium]|nr:hypothetical protein [bacterium]